MIVSHKYKFIFVKTRKTAGTSIEVFLSTFCGDDDIVTPIKPHVEPHIARNYESNGFLNHIPASKIRAKLPKDIWDSYFKFCVERNPWDKTLSHYHHIASRRKPQVLSLDDYFSEKSFPTDANKYLDRDGSLLVDKVLSYENLNEELASTFKLLGIPFSGQLGVRAKSNYRQDKRSYREVLTPEQRAIIEKEFAREIELLNYEF